MRFGIVILPDSSWSVARQRWRSAEAMGFDHAWTYDHLTWRSLRDRPWFAAVPTLVAAAVETSRIRLGTLVTSPTFRHPVTFAKELMTLDDISEGRVTAGIGAGGDGFDATALRTEAWSRRERTERFEEFVALLDQLLTKPTISAAGRYYVANDARAIPGSRQRPRIPFAIAATGPRGLRLAARHGATWIATDSRGAGRDLVERLGEACVAEGRDPASIARLVLLGHRERPLASLEAFREVAGRYEDAGFSDLVVHWPRQDEPFAADLGVLERIAADVLSAPGRPSVYEAAGGEEGLLRLAKAWHARVLADEVVGHAFSGGFHQDHTRRLAAYWTEALGGLPTYSSLYGDETAVVRLHSGNGQHEEMDRRAIACFDEALEDAGLATDDTLRQTLHDYFAWVTKTALAGYPDSADEVPTGLRIPRWSWDGLQVE